MKKKSLIQVALKILKNVILFTTSKLKGRCFEGLEVQEPNQAILNSCSSFTMKRLNFNKKNIYMLKSMKRYFNPLHEGVSGYLYKHLEVYLVHGLFFKKR